MSSIPAWVERHMWKGTVVKFINDTYYLYTNKSKRVPGKKYPQPVQKCIGSITEEGLFINAKIPFVNSGIKVYEYGFTLAVETLWNQCSIHIGKDEKDRDEVLKQLVVRRSPESWFNFKMKDVGWHGQEKALDLYKGLLEKWSGFKLNELEVLKTIYLMDLGDGVRIVSFVADGQKKLLDRIGADLYGYNPKRNKKDCEA